MQGRAAPQGASNGSGSSKAQEKKLGEIFDQYKGVWAVHLHGGHGDREVGSLQADAQMWTRKRPPSRLTGR